jgi:hypothetical protein
MARHFGRTQPITQPLPDDTYNRIHPEAPPWYPLHDDPADVEDGDDDDQE